MAFEVNFPDSSDDDIRLLNHKYSWNGTALWSCSVGLHVLDSHILSSKHEKSFCLGLAILFFFLLEGLCVCRGRSIGKRKADLFRSLSVGNNYWCALKGIFGWWMCFWVMRFSLVIFKLPVFRTEYMAFNVIFYLVSHSIIPL